MEYSIFNCLTNFWLTTNVNRSEQAVCELRADEI